MILDRMGILRALFGSRRAAAEVSGRWMLADEAEPELARDIVRLSGLLAKAPARFAEGVEVPDPLCPLRLARAEGRRELALDLLALMKVSSADMAAMMEED